LEDLKFSIRNSTTNAKQYTFRRGIIQVSRILSDITNLKSKLKEEMAVGRPACAQMKESVTAIQLNELRDEVSNSSNETCHSVVRVKTETCPCA
jgi:hypothetical protein